MNCVRTTSAFYMNERTYNLGWSEASAGNDAGNKDNPKRDLPRQLKKRRRIEETAPTDSGKIRKIMPKGISLTISFLDR